MRRHAEWEEVRRYRDQRAIFRDRVEYECKLLSSYYTDELVFVSYWDFYCRHPFSDSALPLECICPCLSSSIIFKEQDSTMFKRLRIERQKTRGLYASSDTVWMYFAILSPVNSVSISIG